MEIRLHVIRRSTCALVVLSLLLAGCTPTGEPRVSGLAAEVGSLGTQGPAGPAGADGATGPQGPAGSAGADGATGPQGPGGERGLTGLQGAPGADGAMGSTGAEGAAGPQGPEGPQGFTGAAGATGTSSVKITELSVCGPAGNELCKIGMTGPGGGIVFFIDYHDQYPSFCAEGDCNYLEVAESGAGPLNSRGSATHLWCAPTGSTASIDAVVNAGGTYTYTTTAAHNFSIGQNVTIRGVDPIGYNITNVAISARPSDTSFTVTGQGADAGAYLAGGTVSSPSVGASSAVNAGGTYTYTTRTEHGLAVGSLVTTTGFTPGGYNIANQVVATVPTPRTFTVTAQATGTGVYAEDTGHIFSFLSPGTTGSTTNVNTAVGAGRTNTAHMLGGAPARCEAGAAVVANEYSTAQAAAGSWWLPSMGELMLMYTNLRQAGAGGFTFDVQFSWSSSEDNLVQALAKGFYFGNLIASPKGDGLRVLPVRGF